MQLPLWLSHLLLCPSRKSPVYFVAILWCATSRFFFILVIETGHSSALLSNVERTSASWSLVFTGNWSRCIAAKIPSTIPISGLWSGLAPKSNGLLPARHPAPWKVVKKFRLLFELTGNYMLNFPISHGKKSFKKFPDSHPDDLQTLMATSLSRDISLVKF